MKKSINEWMKKSINAQTINRINEYMDKWIYK